jgi:predicted secreted protein
VADLLTPPVVNIGKDGTAEIAASGHGVGGYMWTAEVIKGKGQLAELEPEVAAGIGGGSTARFKLKWKGDSEGLVRLHYRRPWDSDDEAVKDVKIVPGDRQT